MTDSNSCQFCDAGPGEVAFVKYRADPNDSQAEADWYDDVAPTIFSIVCTNCGLGRAALDPRQEDDLPDVDDLPDGTSSSDYRIDEELE